MRIQVLWYILGPRRLPSGAPRLSSFTKNSSPAPTLGPPLWDDLSHGDSWSQCLCLGDLQDKMSEVCN